MNKHKNVKNSPLIKTRSQSKVNYSITTPKNNSLKTESPTLPTQQKNNISKNLQKEKHTGKEITNKELLKLNNGLIPNKNKPESFNKTEEKHNILTIKNDSTNLENINLKKELSSCKETLSVLGDTWLTDNIISKYFEILKMKLVGSEEFVFLMDPIISHAIKTLHEINIFLDPLPIHKKELIIIPVNNCNEQNEDGSQKLISPDKKNDNRGSHWSLLMFRKETSNFFYYDSAHNTNLSDATVIAQKVASYFKVPYTGIIPISGPSQTNSFDCGIYVLLAVEYILQNVTKQDCVGNIVIPQFSGLDCIKKRSYVAYILNRGIVINKATLVSLMVSCDKTNDSCLGDMGGSKGEVVCNNKQFIQTNAIKNRKLHNEVKGTQLSRDIQLSGSIYHNSNSTKNRFPILEDSTPVITDYNLPNIKFNCNYKTPHKSENPLSTANMKANENCLNIQSLQAYPNESKNSITILADSQGRNLACLANTLVDNKRKVFGHVQPGALLRDVVKPAASDPNLKSYRENDWTVVIGGSNDLANYKGKHPDILSKQLVSILEDQIKLFKNSNVILATIPYRYDLPHNDTRQNLVSEVNNEIRKLVYKNENTHLLDLYLLERFYHTNQGFHINKRGKKFVTRLIYNTVMGKTKASNNIYQENAPFKQDGTSLEKSKFSSTVCNTISHASPTMADMSTVTLSSPWRGWSSPEQLPRGLDVSQLREPSCAQDYTEVNPVNPQANRVREVSGCESVLSSFSKLSSAKAAPTSSNTDPMSDGLVVQVPLASGNDPPQDHHLLD